jgi:hypothetical protein
MDTISKEHGFWAKLMSDVIKQTKTERNVKTIAKRLIDAPEMQTLAVQPRKAIEMSRFPHQTLLSKSLLSVRDSLTNKLPFVFPLNVIPHLLAWSHTSDDDKVEQVQVGSTATDLPHDQDQQVFYKVMVETMQKMQHAPQQNKNIVVIFHKHKIPSMELNYRIAWSG